MTRNISLGIGYSQKGMVNDMLILNRKIGESIILDDDIEIKILDIQDGRIKIGIEAPKNISILRKEVYDEVIEENKKSLDVDIDVLKILNG